MYKFNLILSYHITKTLSIAGKILILMINKYLSFIIVQYFAKNDFNLVRLSPSQRIILIKIALYTIASSVDCIISTLMLT